MSRQAIISISLALLAGLVFFGAGLVNAQPAASAGSTKLTFTSAADSYVSQTLPKTNYGHGDALQLDASPALRTYLRFDIQGLSGPIKTAKLRLFALNSSTTGYGLHPISDNSWQETNITYNNAPPMGPVAATSHPFGANRWVSIDVTALVSGNGKWSLALTSPDNGSISFASRESGAHAPQLIIKTTIGTPTSVAASTPTPTSTSTDTPIPPTSISTLTNTPVPPTPTPTWTAAPSNVYYVSTTGSDSNPGTQVQPWKTIQKAADNAPTGSSVIVLDGNYPELVSIKRSSLTFVAQHHVITQGFLITGNMNRVKGFKVTNLDSNWGIEVSGNGNIIEDNDIHNTKQDGIWFFGSNHIIRGNVIHDILQRPDDPHIDCFQTSGPASNIVFEDNLCINSNTYGSNQIGMIESRADNTIHDLILRNNIFVMYASHAGQLNFHRHTELGEGVISNITVVNNTFVHLSGMGNESIWMINIANGTVRNNVFVNWGDSTHSYVLVSGISSDKDIGNNAIYKTSGSAPMGGPHPGDIWMQDPMFVDLSGLDFQLNPTSPLIDKGANVGSLVIDDFDENPRPEGGGYDIGAYEHAPITLSSISVRVGSARVLIL